MASLRAAPIVTAGRDRPVGKSENERQREKEREHARGERSGEELSSVPVYTVPTHEVFPRVIYASAKSYALRRCRMYANLVQRRVVTSRPFGGTRAHVRPIRRKTIATIARGRCVTQRGAITRASGIRRCTVRMFSLRAIFTTYSKARRLRR